MINGFAALLFRMNYINRWGIMRNTRFESLSEHSFCVSYIAHLLACIARERFCADVAPERVMCCALYHDAAEIMTGDLPTPVKYGNEQLKTEYKKVESDAEQRIGLMIPEAERRTISAYITGACLSERERSILKAADKLSALIKCVEEEQNGNSEFKSAKSTTLAALEASPLPEVGVFLSEMLPAFSMTLDQLMEL